MNDAAVELYRSDSIHFTDGPGQKACLTKQEIRADENSSEHWERERGEDKEREGIVADSQGEIKRELDKLKEELA